MRRHYQPHSAVYGSEKWNQLDRTNPFSIVLHDGSTAMRIDGSIAMSRKMFSCRGHSGTLQTANECAAHACNQLRVLTKRAGADNRIQGIAVDIAHRREVNINAYGRKLFPDSTSKLVGKLV